MGLLRYTPPKQKVKAKKPNAEERQRQAEWAKMLAAHSTPLERGATAKGVKITRLPPKKVASALIESEVQAAKPKIKSLPMGDGGTKPVVDPLAEAKRKLAARTGQLFNKGGIQYLSDTDLAEQKTGSHKRR